MELVEDVLGLVEVGAEEFGCLLDLDASTPERAGHEMDEPLGHEPASGGVNLLIHAKDKISWFILPTFSYSEDNYGGGIGTAVADALTQSGDYPNFFRTIAPDDRQANDTGGLPVG